MADQVLQYQRAGAGVITPTRRKVAAMLAVAAAGLVLFAGLVGFDLFMTFVRVRVFGPWRPIAGGFERPLLTVYHWGNLLWIGGILAAILTLAATYWFLGRAMGRRRDRTLTIAALVLAMMHTLGAVLFSLNFILVGFANLRFAKWGLLMMVEVAASFLALAMVPGMLWVSIRLMDLLGERVVARRSGANLSKEEPPSPPPEGGTPGVIPDEPTC